MANGNGSSGRRNALVLLLVLASVVMVIAVILQEDGSGATNPGDGQRPTSNRQPDQGAPPRRPIVIERSETPDGALKTIVVLPAQADAYTMSAWPNQNFGRHTLYLGYNVDQGLGAQRILLHFAVEENVPPDSVVNEARLRLHAQYASPLDDTPMGTHVRQLESTWEELGVSWNDGPEWGPVQAEGQVGGAPRWYEWDVTPLTEDWVSEAAQNYGLIIIGDEAVQQRERAFHSRETPIEGAAAEFYPQLIVEYTRSHDDQAPVARISPLPAYVRPGFIVSWTGDDRGGSGIAIYDVEYRVDRGDWTAWLDDTAFTSAVFEGGENERHYGFRVRAEDRAGNVEVFGAAEASTTVDDESPTSSVTRYPRDVHEAAFNLGWTGHDHGSGVRYFDVQYRLNGGDWTIWQQRTSATSATFTALADGRYDFEVRAVDGVGLWEAFTGRPEASVIVDARASFSTP